MCAARDRVKLRGTEAWGGFEVWKPGRGAESERARADGRLKTVPEGQGGRDVWFAGVQTPSLLEVPGQLSLP